RVQVVDIPRAGHFVIVEQPDPVAAAVTEFIGGTRGNSQWRSAKFCGQSHPLLVTRPQLLTGGSPQHRHGAPPCPTTPFTPTALLPMRRKFGPGWASRALPGHRSSFPSSCRNRI